MPLYEFHCNACGKDMEILLPSADWRGVKCPSCGSTQLVKKLSVFAAARASGGGEETIMPCGMPAGADGCCGGACSMD
jgi:putative FmdB family regulatory protein